MLILLTTRTLLVTVILLLAVISPVFSHHGAGVREQQIDTALIGQACHAGVRDASMTSPARRTIHAADRAQARDHSRPVRRGSL
jgi:hypothetical protein